MYLGVETSSAVGGLAIADHEKIIALANWQRSPEKKRQSHSELITTELQSLLKQTGVKLGDLQGLVVTTGPGSFTGIRVGLNHVKTLSYALQIPIFAFSTLETLAFSHEAEGRVLCLLNAFRNMVYAAVYERTAADVLPLQAPEAVTMQKLERWIDRPTVTLGDGYATYETTLPESLKSRLVCRKDADHLPSVENLMKLFFVRRKQAATFNWKELRPLYLRPSSAEENREKGLLKPLLKLEN